jgi:hypothetical protein
VIDDGTGLLPDQLESLFEDPTRVELGARRRFTGLDLPLAHQLLEKMGGSISVRSAFGEGSTFTLHLPAATDVPIEPARVRPGVAHPLVIVDRHPESVRAWLREELARAGIGPVCWHDGEFLELVALRPRALAIDLDAGDVLLADVLADSAFVGVPIVAATGIVHDRPRTLPDGVAALLDAPFDPRELVPSLVLAERAIRGCVLVGRVHELSDLRDGLVARSWTVLVFGDVAHAADALADRPPALLVFVDGDPEAPLPEGLADIPTVYATGVGSVREQVDRIALALASLART